MRYTVRLWIPDDGTPPSVYRTASYRRWHEVQVWVRDGELQVASPCASAGSVARLWCACFDILPFAQTRHSLMHELLAYLIRWGVRDDAVAELAQWYASVAHPPAVGVAVVQIAQRYLSLYDSQAGMAWFDACRLDDAHQARLLADRAHAPDPAWLPLLRRYYRRTQCDAYWERWREPIRRALVACLRAR